MHTEVLVTGHKSSQFEVIEDSELPEMTKLQENIIPKRKILQFVENLDICADLKAILVNTT